MQQHQVGTWYALLEVLLLALQSYVPCPGCQVPGIPQGGKGKNFYKIPHHSFPPNQLSGCFFLLQPYIVSLFPSCIRPYPCSLHLMNTSIYLICPTQSRLLCVYAIINDLSHGALTRKATRSPNPLLFNSISRYNSIFFPVRSDLPFLITVQVKTRFYSVL